MKDRHPHRSAIRDRSPRLLAGRHILHQPGDDGENRASGAAADDLTHDGPEIEVAASRTCDRRKDGLQNLTSADAANSASDGVAEIAQIVVLQRSAGGVPAGDPRDELNDQIDDRFHSASLSLAARCCCPRLPISPHAFPVCRVLRASDEAPACCRLDRPHSWIDRQSTRASAKPFPHSDAWLGSLDAYVDYSAQRMRHAKCITTSVKRICNMCQRR